jgi:prefoldin subunit 5
MERLLKENRELMQQLRAADEKITELQGQLNELRSPRTAADP